MPINILNRANNSDDSLAFKKERAAKNIINSVQSAHTTLLNTQKNVFKAVWNNPQGLTAQQVLDALGSKASELFLVGSKTVDFLLSLEADVIKPDEFLPYKEVVINANGTVTVTNTPNANRVALGLPTSIE